MAVLQQKTPCFHGVFKFLRAGTGQLFTPHVLQACVAQLPQVGALWAMERPSEWAKKSEITREVSSPWQ